MDRRTLHDLGKKKLQRLDERALRLLDKLIEDDLPRGKTLEVLESLKLQHAEKGFLTESQRNLVRTINKQFDSYEFEHALCAKLAELLEAGKTPNTAESFIRSVIEFFNRTHSITPLQLEQAVKIASAYDDPDEDESEKIVDDDGII